jgi:hypothetical protein
MLTYVEVKQKCSTPAPTNTAASKALPVDKRHPSKSLSYAPCLVAMQQTLQFGSDKVGQN